MREKKFDTVNENESIKSVKKNALTSHGSGRKACHAMRNELRVLLGGCLQDEHVDRLIYSTM